MLQLTAIWTAHKRVCVHNYHNNVALLVLTCLFIFYAIQWSLTVVKLGNIWALEWHICQIGTLEDCHMGLWSIQPTMTRGVPGLFMDFLKHPKHIALYVRLKPTKTSSTCSFCYPEQWCTSYNPLNKYILKEHSFKLGFTTWEIKKSHPLTSIWYEFDFFITLVYTIPPGGGINFGLGIGMSGVKCWTWGLVQRISDKYGACWLIFLTNCLLSELILAQI